MPFFRDFCVTQVTIIAHVNFHIFPRPLKLKKLTSHDQKITKIASSSFNGWPSSFRWFLDSKYFVHGLSRKAIDSYRHATNNEALHKFRASVLTCLSMSFFTVSVVQKRVPSNERPKSSPHG